MTPDAIIFAFVVVLLAAVAVIAFFSHRRRQRFKPTESRDHIFLCSQCGYVYTDDEDVELSRCPQCGGMNEEMKF
jgi:rubrerythrin